MSLSRKQATAQRRALERDIRADHAKKAKGKVRDLDAELRAARARRDEALANARDRCRADRLTVRVRVAALREDALAKLREAVRLERQAARETCSLRKDEARRATVPIIERAKRELDAERAYQAELRRIELANKKRRAALPRVSRSERRAESDDEVRANIAPDLRPLFERVKRQIRASARESRTEAFLRYAEEHPAEVLATLDDGADRLVRELEARQREEARRGRGRSRGPVRAVPRRYTAAELADVPF